VFVVSTATLSATGATSLVVSCQRCGRQDALGVEAGRFSAITGAVIIPSLGADDEALCGLCATTVPGAADRFESWSWLSWTIETGPELAPPPVAAPAARATDDLLDRLLTMTSGRHRLVSA
jgi:hypothetical protein